MRRNGPLLALILSAPLLSGFGDFGREGHGPAIASGGFQSCAIVSGGAIECWGASAEGRLGDGQCGRTGRGPVRVRGVADATVIATGDAHACALFDDGRVACWGRNDHGQLGDGSKRSSCAPVAVRGLSEGGISLAAGFSHTCAVLRSSRVVCWGSAVGGRLGEGTLAGDSTRPREVFGLSAVLGVVAGDAHTCGLLADGRVTCWGEDHFDQLGDSARTHTGLPVEVTGVTEAVELASGATHTCARTLAGRVFCWGSGIRGQIGDGGLRSRPTAVPVPLDELSATIGAGAAHSCAVSISGRLSCWGSNQSLQLSDSAHVDRPNPVEIPSVLRAHAIVGGDDHSCAWIPGQPLLCWGGNSFGQLGTGESGQPRSAPAAARVTPALETKSL